MTNHYNIEIIETKTHLKVTYRDKKFRKLEHLRGKLDKAMLRQLGRIIPRHEDDFGEYNKAFDGKVLYTIIVQEKSLYTKFLDEWYSFYDNFAGMPPKFTAVDGKSLNAIITHLKLLNHQNEAEALELWKVLLDNWKDLNDFHKDNTDLKYINSKLNPILNAIKRKNQAHSNVVGGSVEL